MGDAKSGRNAEDDASMRSFLARSLARVGMSSARSAMASARYRISPMAISTCRSPISSCPA